MNNDLKERDVTIAQHRDETDNLNQTILKLTEQNNKTYKMLAVSTQKNIQLSSLQDILDSKHIKIEQLFDENVQYKIDNTKLPEGKGCTNTNR